MYPVTKSIEALLNQLADLLPQVQVSTYEVHKTKGSEILSWNTVAEIDGKPINPEQIYDYRWPVIMPANHKRRLRKKYKRKGIPGVRQYLEWVIGLQDESEPIPVLQAVMETLKEIDEENFDNGPEPKC